jgi:uncharacterized DUF497 family protein
MYFDCLDTHNIVKFDWDSGNISKNELKHNIKWQIIEEVFLNQPLMLIKDTKHSVNECRCFALGITNDKQKLFVVFTKRDDKIRAISARPMNKKERDIYENFKSNT